MYISIDIGGTNTRLAISKDLDKIDEIQKFPTSKNLHDLQDIIANFVNQQGNIQKISLGVAGVIDKSTNQIIYCPHIPYLSGPSAIDLLPKDFNATQILLENDATLAGLGEATKGVGKEFDRVAYITISTGVGGTLIINKQIQSKKVNFEPGHIILNLDETFNYKKNLRGIFESFCSGTAFKMRFGLEPSGVVDKRIWEDYGQVLAVGLYNIILLWQPECIVLGGSMSKKSALFYKSMQAALQKLTTHDLPKIKISELADANGIIGGFQNIKNSLA